MHTLHSHTQHTLTYTSLTLTLSLAHTLITVWTLSASVYCTGSTVEHIETTTQAHNITRYTLGTYWSHYSCLPVKHCRPEEVVGYWHDMINTHSLNKHKQRMDTVYRNYTHTHTHTHTHTLLKTYTHTHTHTHTHSAKDILLEFSISISSLFHNAQYRAQLSTKWSKL